MPSDLNGIASDDAVHKALSRLVKNGTIRRLARGLYDYPRISAKLGALSPDPDAVAAALARKDGSKVEISPARAANLFGLTTQVPSKLVYLTSGSDRDAVIGQRTVRLKHAAPKNLVGAGTPSGKVFQALRYVGKDGADHVVVAKLAKALPADVRARLPAEAASAPAWMRPVARQIAETA